MKYIEVENTNKPGFHPVRGGWGKLPPPKGKSKKKKKKREKKGERRERRGNVYFFDATIYTRPLRLRS